MFFVSCFHGSGLDEQVKATLPSVFKEKFATTYAIIDGSEIFIETPSDLLMQSSV